MLRSPHRQIIIISFDLFFVFCLFFLIYHSTQQHPKDAIAVARPTKKRENHLILVAVFFVSVVCFVLYFVLKNWTEDRHCFCCRCCCRRHRRRCGCCVLPFLNLVFVFLGNFEQRCEDVTRKKPCLHCPLGFFHCSYSCVRRIVWRNKWKNVDFWCCSRLRAFLMKVPRTDRHLIDLEERLKQWIST